MVLSFKSKPRNHVRFTPMRATQNKTSTAITPAVFKRMQRDLALTNPQVAVRLGVSLSTIQKWRAGNVRIPAAIGDLMKFLVLNR